MRGWLASVADDELFLSVLVLGEVRRGVESIRRRDPSSATALDSWLLRVVADYGSHILPVTTEIAEMWGRFNVPRTLPVVDSLLAATAHVHGLTLVTRNVRDVTSTGVPVLNPFLPRGEAPVRNV